MSVSTISGFLVWCKFSKMYYQSAFGTFPRNLFSVACVKTQKTWEFLIDITKKTTFLIDFQFLYKFSIVCDARILISNVIPFS